MSFILPSLFTQLFDAYLQSQKADLVLIIQMFGALFLKISIKMLKIYPRIIN